MANDFEVAPVVHHGDTATPFEEKYEDKKYEDEYEITAADDGEKGMANPSAVTDEMRNKVLERYGVQIDDNAALGSRQDIVLLIDKIIEMSDDEAIDILVNAAEFHADDPNFPARTLVLIKQLVQGYKACEMEAADWSFEIRTEASLIYWHSPYPEVRAVTEPFDDPTIPCETIRAWVLGLCFMAGTTALNTFFSPRQPGIGIGSNVLQLLIVPLGTGLAKVTPDWGFTFRGTRWSLNPGPWTYKEQMFSTIIFSTANGAGSVYYIYLVQMMPQYLDQKWVTYGYEITLALATQFFGLGFAGFLRRFVIYPVTAIWPGVLPTLALNRTLIAKEPQDLVTNGWRITRYKFFLLAMAFMFVYFWIPNTFFQAIRLFNWMTWIAPNNFNLAMITGSYGGMGFNPWSTFDWNVMGGGSLVTPFFSAAQQYMARVLSGLIIIGMYYGNYVWSAYTPINSNESFNNKGGIYNVTLVLGEHGYIDMDKYKAYGPPYFSGANVFGQGAWFAWYPLTVIYMTFVHWAGIKKASKGMYRSVRYRTSIWEDNIDAQSRMMAAYPEVPDWWFAVVLVLSAIMSIVALTVYPAETPWWIIFPLLGINFVFLVPSAILTAGANVGMGFNVLWQLLAGVWFAGNPQAQIIVTAFGQNFDGEAESYITQQKMAHYSKLPPRSIFRAQIAALLFNCFIFIGMLNWMVTNFNGGGTLCTWDNPEHFVCTDAVLYFASAIEYGAFGVRNMFKLYPIMPWCFLIGTLIGLGWGLAYVYAPRIDDYLRRTWNPERYETIDRYCLRWIKHLKYFNPAVFWAGALNWTGGNNLTYATGGLYLSFIFMYWIKRRYTPWWQRYNYILTAAFGVGIALSGLLQTLVFDFGNVSFPNWWGNEVYQKGLDWQSYNQNSTLLPIPEVGYFGLPPEKYPMSF